MHYFATISLYANIATDMAYKQENYLYTTDQVRALDRLAIEQGGVSGLQLMQRAGSSIFDYIVKHYPNTPITIFCGSGNNGGDGYVVATLAKEQNTPAQLIHIKPPQQLKNDAKLAYNIALRAGVSMADFSQDIVLKQGIVVDALLGTGLKGPVKGDYYNAIKLINKSNLPVISVDLPSGLNADTGNVENACVNAQTTISFIGLKQGLFTHFGPDYCGKIVFEDLQVKPSLFDDIHPSSVKLQLNELLKHLKPRKASAHKNIYGHVLVVGGDYGYSGATLLAAEAALRTGAGLVSVATRKEHVSAIIAKRPEIMAHGIESAESLQGLVDKATVLIIGPGLGQSQWSKKLLIRLLKSKLPSILDADALNLISQEKIKLETKNKLYILTPHPKEAARLLDQDTTEIQNNRFTAVKKIAKHHHAQVLLKGAGSLVCISLDSAIGVCVAGNPGMATGGMGDVLSGIIGGLLAQGVNQNKCLPLAVCLHAEAGDIAARRQQRSLLPSDLFNPLRRLIG
jgi:NAD(P)H-hydrate epimerase